MSDNENRNNLEVAVRSILSPTEFGREENQDNYLIIDDQGNARFLLNQQETSRQLENWPQGHTRLAILDGMGGHSYGREAAENTVQRLLAVPPATDVGTLSKDLEALHSRLRKELHRLGGEPGCTLTLLEIPPSGPALLFHAGDSRLYAIDEQGPSCLTVDHVPATKFAMRGMISEQEWIREVFVQPHAQLCQAFILGNTFGDRASFIDDLKPELFELHDDNLPSFLQGLGDRRPIELEPDRIYLLASDGLWHLARPLDFIERWPDYLVHSDQPLQARLDDLFEELIRISREEERLGGDNSTAIAFRVRRP